VQIIRSILAPAPLFWFAAPCLLAAELAGPSWVAAGGTATFSVRQPGAAEPSICQWSLPGSVLGRIGAHSGLFEAPSGILDIMWLTVRGRWGSGAEDFVDRLIQLGPEPSVAGPWLDLLAGSPKAGGAVRTGAGDQARFAYLAQAAWLEQDHPDPEFRGKWLLVDAASHRLLRMGGDGTVEPWLGGEEGWKDGKGADAQFRFPQGLATWPRGEQARSGQEEPWRVLVVDTGNHVLRLVEAGKAGTGVITYAGRVQEPGHEDGPLDKATFRMPRGAVIGPDETIYVADTGNGLIRRIAKGMVTTLAGAATDKAERYQADGKGAAASFFGPTALVLDPVTSCLYVADGCAIRRVTPDGTVTTVAGRLRYIDEPRTLPHGFESWKGDPSAKSRSMVDRPCLGFPKGLSLHGRRLLIADSANHAVRVLDLATGQLTTVAGSPKGTRYLPGKPREWPYLGWVARNETGCAALPHPTHATLDAKGRCIILLGPDPDGGGKAGSCVVSMGIDPLGAFQPGTEPGKSAAPAGSAAPSAAQPTVGAIKLLAGEAGAGVTAQGPGGAARFVDLAQAVWLEEDHPSSPFRGKWLVVDRGRHQILLVDRDGRVEVWLGHGGKGFKNGNAAQAQFAFPAGIAILPGGAGAPWRALVADQGNHAIRLVEVGPKGTTVSTWAGRPEAAGHNTGARLEAGFNAPEGIAVAENGDVYVADTGNRQIRRIRKDWVTTLAGEATGMGLARAKQIDGKRPWGTFRGPTGIVLDPRTQILYVSDRDAIRAVHPDGTVGTLAGKLYAGEAGLETAGFEAWMAALDPDAKETASLAGVACLSAPRNLTLVGRWLVIPDAGNAAVRLLDLDSGRMSTLAGHRSCPAFHPGLGLNGKHLPEEQWLDLKGSRPYATLTPPSHVAFDGKGRALVLMNRASAGSGAIAELDLGGAGLEEPGAGALELKAEAPATRFDAPGAGTLEFKAAVLDPAAEAPEASPETGAEALWIGPLAGLSAQGEAHPFGDLAHAVWVGDQHPDPRFRATWVVADRDRHGLLFLGADGKAVPWVGIPAETGGYQEGGPQEARFATPVAVALLPPGCDPAALPDAPADRTGKAEPAAGLRVLAADRDNHAIRLVEATAEGTLVRTLAAASGQPGTQDGPCLEARFHSPEGLTVGPDGAVYVADTGNRRIRKIHQGRVTTFAGRREGELPRIQVDGPGDEAIFLQPSALVADPRNGDLYVADGKAVRRIRPDGRVGTVAGSLQAHPDQENGSVFRPEGLSLDEHSLFITDRTAGVIWRLDLETHRLRTFAGLPGTDAFQAGRLRFAAEASPTSPAEYEGRAILPRPAHLAFGAKGLGLILLGRDRNGGTGASCAALLTPPGAAAEAPAPTAGPAEAPKAPDRRHRSEITLEHPLMAPDTSVEAPAPAAAPAEAPKAPDRRHRSEITLEHPLMALDTSGNPTTRHSPQERKLPEPVR
jgi:DNA-binding beta-propeller fold protein YncE